jgi:hypothetical protein
MQKQEKSHKKAIFLKIEERNQRDSLDFGVLFKKFSSQH